MKNKALTYVLLIVVGIIWYQVFFRVKDNLLGEETTIPKPNEMLASVNIISRDTVALNIDYRDPFRYKKGARISSAVNDMNRPLSNTPQVARPQKPTFVWPKITYHGLIRNRSSKAPLALVRVDGLVYNLRERDEIFNSIYVKSIGTNELVVRYKKHTQTIPIQ